MVILSHARTQMDHRASMMTDGRPAASLSLPDGCSLSTYVDYLRATGFHVSPGSQGTYWASFGDRVAWRLPMFCVGTPDRSEVDHAIRATGTLAATYLMEPAERHAANAWLYLCGEQGYSLEMRPPEMQRNVRRAMRELTITPLSPEEVLTHGAPPFCDTRERNGLDDGTPDHFRRDFRSHVHRPGRAYLGAWKNGQLVAFLTILHVDDWMELEFGCFSMTAALTYRPNELLMHLALSKYLLERKCRIVNYGLSSIQAQSGAAGLHRFKRKIGFLPRPVHRAFVLHPLLRPLANRATLTVAHGLVNGALRLKPRNRRLKQMGGMLACMLGATWMMRAAGEADAGPGDSAAQQNPV
jgi:hypothetical protein